MENHQLNAAAFAEKIGVQRSSVSHILSRRNKPSLEFILKVQAEFTEADFDWLLLGARKKSSPTSNQLLIDQGKVDELEADKSINPPQKSISTSSRAQSFIASSILLLLLTHNRLAYL